jgi:hypothetical protein
MSTGVALGACRKRIVVRVEELAWAGIWLRPLCNRGLRVARDYNRRVGRWSRRNGRVSIDRWRDGPFAGTIGIRRAGGESFQIREIRR